MMNIMREKRGEKDGERDDAHGVAVEEYVSVRVTGRFVWDFSVTDLVTCNHRSAAMVQSWRMTWNLSRLLLFYSSYSN